MAKQVSVHTDLKQAIQMYIEKLEREECIRKADTTHITSFDMLRYHIDTHKNHNSGKFNEYNEPVYTWEYILNEDCITVPIDIKLSVSTK